MKLKIIHLLTDPDSNREKRSINDITQLQSIGEIEWYINKKWDKEIDTNIRAANDRPFELTKGHYGCYKAHKDAILEHLYSKDDFPADALLIFECDAIFAFPIEEIIRRINRAYELCINHDLQVFTFGPKHGGKTIEELDNDGITITQFIETHAYMIPLKSKDLFIDIFNRPWDALDYVYTIYLYDQMKLKIGTFKDQATIVQANGNSLIDNRFKDSENHHKYSKYEEKR